MTVITKNYVVKNRYADSVVLMSIASQLSKLDGVQNVAAMMGTENNKEVLRNTKMINTDGERAEPNDIIICVIAESEELIANIYKKFNEMLDQKSSNKDSGDSKVELSSITDALNEYDDANLVLFSIPGPFVKREAKIALNAGKNIMIFSDNVTIDEEKELKELAYSKGLIVMGPDCGTAIINGKGLAFANAMPIGTFGIIGASGTGIQQVSVILANNGYGVKHAIGLGGRDLSEKIGGLGMLTALDALEEDADIEVVILISKPPHQTVETKIFERLKNYKKKVVVCFLKGNEAECKKRGLPFAATLEDCAKLAICVLNNQEFKGCGYDVPETELKKYIELIKKQAKNKYIRGLYSGGTLCDEALYLFTKAGFEIYSNIPLDPKLKLKDSYKSYKHTLVDLGEDEFTKGRPHPMIDYTLRCQRMEEEAADKDTGILLIDIVTGYGSHINPLEPLVDSIQKINQKNSEIVIVASICGTEWDPQNIKELSKKLKELNVIIMPTNAQAARLIIDALK